MVEKENRKEGDSVGDPALCTVCEMAVIWIQNQLRQKGTKERVLNYINQVKLFWDYKASVMCSKLLNKIVY